MSNDTTESNDNRFYCALFRQTHDCHIIGLFTTLERAQMACHLDYGKVLTWSEMVHGYCIASAGWPDYEIYRVILDKVYEHNFSGGAE